MFLVVVISLPRQTMMRLPVSIFALIATLSVLHHSQLLAEEISLASADPLPSWNDGPAKESVLEFAAKVTTEGGAGYVPAELRIATFDNDGTLWTEQPNYVQAFFLLDRIKSLSAQHPEWKEQEPFASVLKGDLKGAIGGGQQAIEELLMATHAGMTTDEFEKIVTDWLATAQHPRFKRPHTELVYQPMLEVLTFLRAKGFKTYIVSGGGVEFMRPWAEKVYGVPPAQVIGSSIKTKYEIRDGKPVLLRLPELNFIDDHAGKPVGIHSQIGRRPIAAFGNSDGDFEMLEWTTSAPGLRLGMIVHHTDGEREYAYDRKSMVGKLDKGLDEARQRGWRVIDMKQDWRKIYSVDK